MALSTGQLRRCDALSQPILPCYIDRLTYLALHKVRAGYSFLLDHLFEDQHLSKYGNAPHLNQPFGLLYPTDLALHQWCRQSHQHPIPRQVLSLTLQTGSPWLSQHVSSFFNTSQPNFIHYFIWFLPFPPI